MATACVWVGEYERAVHICRRNLELCRRLGDTHLAAVTLGVLGDAYHGLGRYQDAIDLLSQALPVFRDYAHERFEALCLLKPGCAWQALGQPAEKQASGVLDKCLAVTG